MYYFIQIDPSPGSRASFLLRLVLADIFGLSFQNFRYLELLRWKKFLRVSKKKTPNAIMTTKFDGVN